MAKQRRAFNSYPEVLRTRQNNRETFIADDPSFEPEQASFLKGYIGDTSILSEEDLSRTPAILEGTAERQKYQLSVGATYINPVSQERESVATYTDLVNQIESNGGLVDDHNRVFSTEFYAWTPPFDYDKHINFGRYLWIADGTAQVQGEYVTKEPSHSKTLVHVWDGVVLTANPVLIFNGLPTIMAAGIFVEDASTPERSVFLSDGAVWQLLDLEVVSDVPTTFPSPTIQTPPIYYYVARTGPTFQRPLVWKYVDGAGRWIPTPVVVNPDVPDTPREGMIWEDSRLNGERILKVFANGTFQDLSYSVADGPPGSPGVNGDYIYDAREYETLTDPWAIDNWWRHHEDLSPVDRDARSNDDPAVRPIIEFWQGIESVAGDTKASRNDGPIYKKYAINNTTLEGFDTTEGTTIFGYKRGSGQDDTVLGFPVSFNSTGEFIFELTLESDVSSAVGYHYFHDTNTGLLHSIWHRALGQTNQKVDANGLHDVPVGISSNADHEIITEISRSRMVGHMTSVIGSQTNFSGAITGLNSYRWTDKDPTIGATLIDAEETHLRVLATLQKDGIDFPNAIRRMAKDYNKVLFRFENKMNQLWDSLDLTNGNDLLSITASEACDAVLTSIFVGRTSEFPFYHSQMGTYLQTLATNGVATVVDPNPEPIYIPPSPSRVGASSAYTPRLYTRRDGTNALLGHEGVSIASFGDERDLIWLELQTRFFNVVPVSFKTESTAVSSRFDQANFVLNDHYGNYVPPTSIEPVDDVVSDFNAIVTPVDGLRVLSTDTAEFAIFSGGEWLTGPAIVDDVVLNNGDDEYYIFNGLGVFLIDRLNRPFTFEYTTNEFRQVIRREFERFIISRTADFSENTEFDQADPFTWNYSSSGVEGHYLGIFNRVYNTTRPHAAPWEVMGYSIEPDWWNTSYAPDSTAADGTPRYGSAHAIWADFAAGTVAHPSGPITKLQFVMTGPIPVDVVGELLDPIAAGVVDQTKLDMSRIDDIWTFGDGSPMEQEFIESPFYSFSVALAGYLMKNGKWVDTLWVANRVGVGATGTYPVHNAPHVVNRDTLTRPDISTRPIHLSIVAGITEVNIGVHSWISEKVNVEGSSPTTDFADIIRNTSSALVWKTAGYINSDRTIISTLSRNEIPFSDIHVLLHKSQPISQNFCSGVLVAREDTGYRVFGFDPFSPFFTVERAAIPIVGGQVLLEEDFIVDYIETDPITLLNNNVTGGSVFPNTGIQNTFTVTEFGVPSKIRASDTATLSVLVNGMKMKPQHITTDVKTNTVTIEPIVSIQVGDRVAIQVLTTQSNPSTQIRQFIVNNVTFPYFTEGTGEFEQIAYGRFYETSTDVINFMMGYGRFLNAQGWKFTSLSEAGATRDWLLGAKRFARWVLETESTFASNPQVDILDRDVFYYSPIQDIALFESPYGQSTSVETIMNGAYGILNRQSEPVATDSTDVTRIDDAVEVRRVDVTDEASEMFGVRINLIETEHVVVFSNTTRFSDVIYDPVSGLSQRTLVVDSYRTLNWRGRLEADGYILSGGKILPNFEKQAFDFTRFYDRFDTIDDPVKRESARNLYGYVPANSSRISSQSTTPSIERRITSDSSQYMVPVGADDRTRFDYYRGMIQAKGTIRAVYAFARGSTIGRDNFFINEDWAWKVGPGEFGDTRRELVQFDVSRLDFRDEIQVIHFGIVNNNDNTIDIPDFDRTTPDSNPRWIRPPVECETMDTCNLTFPLSRDSGLIDVDDYRFYAKLYDTEENITILDHVQFDPELDKFDTGATCFVDYTTPQDPARYNAGPDAAFSNDRCWREHQVGRTWWRQDRKLYLDYRGILPDYENAAKYWGKLLHYKSAITRTNDTVTMTLYSFTDTSRAGTPVNLTTELGLINGSEVTITVRKANQTEYNLQNQLVTVTSATTGVIEFTIDTSPDSPATGDAEVVIGHIDIFEWVESPVLPSEWEEFVANLSDPTHPNGIPLNVDDPSFVEIIRRNDNNQPTTFYYFWVLNSSGNNGAGKSLTSATLSSRISNPTLNQIPWFAPIDETNMVIFTNGDAVLDTYAIEISIDQRVNQTHGAFVLLSQGSQFFDTPDSIINKMVDSLSGIDEQGNTVPSPLLANSEKYGSCFFPIQTIYSDVNAAIAVYVAATNRLFRRKDLEGTALITGIFKLADEISTTNPNGFWSRVQYKNQTVENESVHETVQTTTERDRRLGLNLYFTGDIVRVIESGNLDIWDGTEVATDYQYDGTSFIEVAVDNHTVAINSNISSDSIRFRGLLGVGGLFTLIYNLLSKTEKNDLVFSMLHEMQVQHPDPRCDWFFKTSYLTTQVFSSTNNSPFVRPDEVSAIRDNILGVKAYRTKLRGDVNTLNIAELEPFDMDIIEFPDKKISLIIDRLSCNALDDCGWDRPAWDSRALPCSVWDKPIWDFDNLGRDEYYLLATIVGDAVASKFVINAIFDPTLYAIKVVVKQNGIAVDADFLAITKSHTQVFIDTQFSLATAFTVEVLQSQGFYAESEPSYIGTTMEGSLFQPPVSDYKHAIARTNVSHTEFVTVVGGDGNTFSTSTGPWIELYLNSTLLEPQVDYTTDFDYAISSYAATLVVAPVPGDSLAFGFIRGCFDVNDDLGGRPEERIVTEICDSVNIAVINDWTLAYQGWDTTPWDITAWDQGPINIGRRVFLLSIGKQGEIPPGLVVFQTSEDILVVDPLAIVGTSPVSYNIAQYELQKGAVGSYVTMTEGVEFGLVGIFNNIITTLVPGQQDFNADGISFVYTTTMGTAIRFVFLDGVLQTEGVDYTLDVTKTIITWIQPATVVFSNKATANTVAFVGDGFTTDFVTGLPTDSLNRGNILVWVNGLRTVDFVVGGIGIQFNSAPTADDEIIIFTLGNNFSDSSTAHTNDGSFTATAAQTIFNTTSGGLASSKNTWVFIDSVYQVLGTDYTITGPDQITLTVPSVGGEIVRIRTLAKGVSDVEHIQFTASGGATDVIPGLFDAQNIDRMLIFVGGDIQNGWAPPPLNPDYTIIDSNPDTINWTTRQELTTFNWSGITGVTLPTGVTPAAWFDISTVATTYRLWFSDGSTTAPVAGGTTLVPVAFVGGDTDQDISDAVVTALISADAEYATTTNGSVTLGGWDITTAGAVEAAFTAEFANPLNTEWNANGTVLYVHQRIGGVNNYITQHPVTTAYDLGTIQASTGTFDAFAAGLDPFGFTIIPDGSEIIICPNSGGLTVHPLSSAGDVTTIGAATFTFTPTINPLKFDCVFSTDGDWFYIQFDSSPRQDILARYAVSTPFDLSTASVAETDLKGFSFDDTSPTRIQWHPDGLLLFVWGGQFDNLKEYQTVTPWAIAGLTLTGNTFAPPPGDTTPPGAGNFTRPTISANGEAIIISAFNEGKLLQYPLDFTYIPGSFIFTVEVATGGVVPDAVDGTVPTAVGISINTQGSGLPVIGDDISVRVVRTVQMSTTVVIDVNPNPGQTVSAQFLPYIEAGDNVRYRFNGWPVEPEGFYVVNPLISPLDTFGYDIVDNVFAFDSLPTENNIFSVTYTRARPGASPESILVRMENVVADILTDHESYDSPNGTNDYRAVGTQIINTTVNQSYTWDGTVWNIDPVPIVGATYYVTRTQQIWQWNGTAFVKLFDVGDAFTKPPVLDYPAFGEGIRYGTYALGTSANAAIEYEDAFQIMQHPGDTPL